MDKILKQQTQKQYARAYYLEHKSRIKAKYAAKKCVGYSIVIDRKPITITFD